MNEIAEREWQVPDTLEDLTQFVLVSKAKLKAYMLKLQTVNKLSVAQEIRDQTLQEAQEVSTALIAAEQRIGELLLSIPKASGGDRRSDDFKNGDATKFEKTKTEVANEMGYSHNDIRDYQQMAKHPDIVKQVLSDAEANGEIATKASVMREIKFYKDRVKAQQEELDALRTKGQTVRTVEVFPDDYNEVKSKARAYDSDMQRLNQKLTDAYNERNKLQDRISELEEKTAGGELHTRVVEGSLFFVAGCGAFVRDYGGYIWITNHLNELSETELKNYEWAIKNVYAWAQKFLQAVEVGKQKTLEVNDG